MHKRPLYTVLFILALSFAKEGRCSVVVAADNPKEGFLLAEKKQTKFQDAAVHRTAASRRIWGEVWKRYRVFPGRGYVYIQRVLPPPILDDGLCPGRRGWQSSAPGKKIGRGLFSTVRKSIQFKWGGHLGWSALDHTGPGCRTPQQVLPVLLP